MSLSDKLSPLKKKRAGYKSYITVCLDKVEALGDGLNFMSDAFFVTITNDEENEKKLFVKVS